MSLGARVKWDMTRLEMVAALSEGSVDAMLACYRILAHGKAVNPALISDIQPLLWLDTLGVYGPRIWTLYTGVCRRDIGELIALLSAWYIGIVHGLAITNASYGLGTIYVRAVIGELKKHVRDFDETARAEVGAHTRRIDGRLNPRR